MIERKCPFCNQILNGGSKHIYACKENKMNLSKDEIKLKFIEYNFGNDILDNVCTDYMNLYSLPMLKDKYNGIDSKSIYFLLKLRNIHIRSISESAIKISTPKQKFTLQSRYGSNIINISQIPEVREKVKTTFMKHYGVDNIWKLPGYNKMCAELHPDVHQKHMEKLHQGCSRYWSQLTSEGLEEHVSKVINAWKSKGFFSSKLEIKLSDLLTKLNIRYKRQFRLPGSTHPYDFYLTDFDALLEVNGNFWHANPKYYDGNQIVNLPGNKVIAKDIWDKDQKYIDYAINQGHNFIILWEDEFDDKLEDTLLNKLKIFMK